MGSSSIYELFQRCTVRIETDGERGTGFFVAPELVLTCEHVVKGVEVGQLRLRWGDVKPQVTAIDVDEALDLALLTLEPMEHPCVRLGGEVTPGDKLYSYGYADPVEKRDGASLTMEAEGTGDRGQILSLKGENIRPGFSGAAVLNQTSLSVCGLIRRERGAVAVPSPRIIRAIGGVAVPLEVILERWPELAERNRAFHQQDDTWAKAVEQELEKRNTGFQVLLGRIEAQMVTQADLDELRDAIRQGQSAIQQLGKYNVTIGQGQDIQIGDQIYNTVNLDDAAIRAIVEAIQQRPQLSGIPNNLPRSGAQKFVGRDEKLNELHELLQQEKSVAVAAIKGMGGVGKTELALQYALAYRAAYPGGLCWLSVRGSDVGTQLVQFARTQLQLTMPDGFTLDEQIAYCWRRWPEGNALLIYDDVTDYGAIRKSSLPPADSRFRVLMTTRLQLGTGIQQLPLNVLSEESALELLGVLAGVERVEAEIETAKELCAWLGYLPLGIELVGRYLARKPDWSLEKMQQRLESKHFEAAALKSYDDDMTAQQGVAAAFELSWVDLSAKAQELACLLSLFAAAPIPWALVEQSLPEADPNDVEDERDSLCNLHLLQRIEQETYGLHPLIREFLQVKQKECSNLDALKRQFVEVMVATAQGIPDTPTQRDIQQNEPHIPHLIEVATNLTDTLTDEQLTWPYSGIGRFYEGQGAYGQAETWRYDCLQTTRDRLGEEHPDVASSLNNLALLYDNQGRYGEAEPLYQDALAMTKRLLGEEHPNVALSLNNLADLYYNQERYGEAEPLYQDALLICEHILGVEHPNTQVLRGNLKVCLNRQNSLTVQIGSYLKKLLSVFS